MASLNSFDFTGRLGRDPKLNETNGGAKVCNMTVAVDTFGDRPTLWVDVSVWGNAADPCARYLVKGREVAIHGTVDDIATFAKQDGTQGTSLRVSTRDVSFIGSREDRQPQSDVPSDGAETPARTEDEADSIPF